MRLRLLKLLRARRRAVEQARLRADLLDWLAPFRSFWESRLDRLPEEQKAVVVLGEIQGMKYQEIGEILGVPVGTIKSRMHAAMEKLKDLLSGTDL